MRKIIKRIFGCNRNDGISANMENWFKVEYGKNWRHAYNHYMVTGSIHYKG